MQVCKASGLRLTTSCWCFRGFSQLLWAALFLTEGQTLTTRCQYQCVTFTYFLQIYEFKNNIFSSNGWAITADASCQFLANFFFIILIDLFVLRLTCWTSEVLPTATGIVLLCTFCTNWSLLPLINAIIPSLRVLRGATHQLLLRLLLRHLLLPSFQRKSFLVLFPPRVTPYLGGLAVFHCRAPMDCSMLSSWPLSWSSTTSLPPPTHLSPTNTRGTCRNKQDMEMLEAQSRLKEHTLSCVCSWDYFFFLSCTLLRGGLWFITVFFIVHHKRLPELTHSAIESEKNIIFFKPIQTHIRRHHIDLMLTCASHLLSD